MSDGYEHERDTLEDRSRVSRVQQGDVLGERYALGELLARRGPTLTWRAFDNVLSRQVLIHLLPPRDAHSDAVLGAARRAAAATDSRFLRVLDAVESDDPMLGSYIVCEYAMGYSIEQVLHYAELSALEAAWIIKEVAEALAGVHAQGLYHRRLNPDSVIITRTGNVKIVGFLIDYALDPDRHEPDDTASERVDVEALGALLYACVVQRWPYGPGFGMPGAPTDAWGVLLPRQVRAGVAPQLDEVVDRLFCRPPRGRVRELHTAYEASIALNRILAGADASGELEHRLRGPGDTPAPPALRRGGTPPSMPSPAIRRASADPVGLPRQARKELPVRTLFLVGLIAIMVLLFVILLVRKLDDRHADATYSSPPQATATGIAPATTSLKIEAAYDFDPLGNKEENPGELPLAIDGKQETAWRSDTYGSADFDKKKSGIGIIVNLGSPQDVTKVSLRLVGAPTDFLVMVPRDGSTTRVPRDNTEQWAEMGSQKDAAETPEVALSQTTKTQFVMIWFTKIPPKKGGGFQAGVSEIGVF